MDCRPNRRRLFWPRWPQRLSPERFGHKFRHSLSKTKKWYTGLKKTRETEKGHKYRQCTSRLGAFMWYACLGHEYGPQRLSPAIWPQGPPRPKKEDTETQKGHK